MPRFNGKGPLGYGPMTGRGMGGCMGGMSYGRGYGRRFYTKKEEEEIIKEELIDLEEEVNALKERLSEIKGK
jgi:hypothetical protein